MMADEQSYRPSAAIDPNIIEALARDAGVDAMPALIASFVRDCAQREAKISAAVELEDMAILELESHALSSSAQTFGAVSLAEIARAIEQDCRNGWLDDALSRAAALPAVASAARRAIEAESARFAEMDTEE